MTPSTSPLLHRLADRLAKGPITFGQVHVTWPGNVRIELRHLDDVGKGPEGLQTHEAPLAARRIALYTASGEYRPLKGAPDLPPGWIMLLESVSDLRIALDAFYPAALALWHASQLGTLRIVPLSETLGRQTGMYRFARTISQEGANRVTEDRCGKGCRRHPLWAGENHVLPAMAGSVPLLCPEACSFLVADMRMAAKAEFEARDAGASAGDLPVA